MITQGEEEVVAVSSPRASVDHTISDDSGTIVLYVRRTPYEARALATALNAAADEAERLSVSH